MSPRIAVFSDLHLPNVPDERNALFAAQLARLRHEKITELWLLGDIYDLLVGPYSFWREIHKEVFDEIEALVRSGCRVLWLEGNHDFHFAKLARDLGVEIWDGVKERAVAGRRVYIAHGDLVDAQDIEYLRWRRTTRHPLFRALLSLAPDRFAAKFLRPRAEASSRKSRGTVRDPVDVIRQKYRDFAAARFREGYQAVFLGHGHVEDLWILGGSFYLNPGSWCGVERRFAFWEPDLEPFPKLETCRIMTS